MAFALVERDDTYVLNQCTRFLARSDGGARHDFGQYAADDPRSAVCEAWRFPIVDAFLDEAAPDSYDYNTVTFVHDGRESRPGSVALVGTFGDLFDPVPLAPVRFLGEETGFWSVSVKVRKAQVHRYLLGVDGSWLPDPINPQQVRSDNGRVWSRFFTDSCHVPLVLSMRERELLGRVVCHLLPFRLPENSRFVREVYSGLDRAGRADQFPLAYKLDEEVGVVNYIDKVLAREERHNADDYHTCLAIIDGLLRRRFGGLDPLTLPPEAYTELYVQMAANAVDGWDNGRYADPRFFLLLLRRHAMTGAFTHPRSGGNSGAAGWSYLETRFRDQHGQTLFDWRQALEAPLGRNTDYRG